MKTLKQFITESVEWVGCLWTSSTAIPLHGNRYAPFKIEDVKEYMNALTTKYKWNPKKEEFVGIIDKLKSEDDIENYIKSYIDERAKTYKSEHRMTYKDFSELVKEIYDEFVTYHDGKPHNWVKNKEGEVLKLEDWLKTYCRYDCDWDGNPGKNARTWEEYIKDEWEDVQKNKKATIEYLTNFAKDYLTNTVNKSESDIRSIKLDEKINFGSVTAGAGRQTRSENGYVKVGEESKEGKTLYLEYTDNKDEAYKLETLGDLLDLLYKYKNCKLLTPAGVLNTKYANAIMLYPLDRNLKSGGLGIIKFR